MFNYVRSGDFKRARRLEPTPQRTASGAPEKAHMLLNGGWVRWQETIRSVAKPFFLVGKQTNKQTTNHMVYIFTMLNVNNAGL